MLVVLDADNVDKMVDIICFLWKHGLAFIVVVLQSIFGRCFI